MPNGEPAVPGTVEFHLHSFRDRIAEPPNLPAVIEEYFAHTDTESALGFVFIGKESGEEKVRGKRYVAGFDRKTAIFLCIQDVFVNISAQRGTDKNLWHECRFALRPFPFVFLPEQIFHAFVFGRAVIAFGVVFADTDSHVRSVLSVELGFIPVRTQEQSGCPGRRFSHLPAYSL